MKIQLGERIYLQKYDAEFIEEVLDSSLSGTPVMFSFEIFRSGEPIAMQGPADAYRFCYDFVFEEVVEWILAQDWLVDYDQCIMLSSKELGQRIAELQDELEREETEFRLKNKGHDDIACAKHNYLCAKIKHHIRSLELMHEYVEGHAKFTFPEGHPQHVPASSASRPGCPNLIGRILHRRHV